MKKKLKSFLKSRNNKMKVKVATFLKKSRKECLKGNGRPKKRINDNGNLSE
jgi:hypothetical protein